MSTTAINQMSDAIAHATLVFAMTTSAVNSVDDGSSTAESTMKFKGNKRFR